MIYVFVSYAHEDSQWFEPKYGLIPYIERSLEHQGVTFWYDAKIGVGSRFAHEIENYIREANIAVLLLSRDFINSRYIAENELPLIAERAHTGELLVVPILIRPCPWEKIPLVQELQIMPGSHTMGFGPTPLIRLRKDEAEWDDALDGIVQELERQVERMNQSGQTVPNWTTKPHSTINTDSLANINSHATPTPLLLPLTPELVPQAPLYEAREKLPDGWPPDGWFDADAAEVWTKAAGVAAADGDMMTSAHLCWALLSLDSPLTRWMKDNQFPLEEAKQLMALCISGDTQETGMRVQLCEAPAMSATIEGIWNWAQEQPRENPITIEQLTQQFAAVQGNVTGELLSWLQIDLSTYPTVTKRLELSPQAEEVLRIAHETSLWNKRQVTTTHLWLGFLEEGNNALCRFLQQAGETPAAEALKLREKLLIGTPGPSGEVFHSLNVIRIISESEHLTRAEGRLQIEVDDLLAAAVKLQAGALGTALKEADFEVANYPPINDGPTSSAARLTKKPSELNVPMLLLQTASLCALHCGHTMIGTPHVLAAGLHLYEPLQASVRNQSVEPNQLVIEIACAMGCPRDEDPFARISNCPILPLSPNLYTAIQSEVQAKKHLPQIELSILDLIVAILNHSTGQAVQLLQSHGINPSLIVRDLM